MSKFDFTEEDSSRHLRGYDLPAIKKAFGADVTELGSEMLTAVTWALLNHDTEPRLSKKDVEDMSIGEMKDLYAPMPDEAADLGK